MIYDILKKCQEMETEVKTAQEQLVQEFLEQGVQIDPKALFQNIDMTHTRMLRLYITKQLACHLELEGEWPKILVKELDMLYTSNIADRYIPRTVGEKK